MKKRKVNTLFCIKNAHIYAPEDLGIQDVMIAGGKIEKIAPKLTYENMETIDATGLILVPGMIDQHIHITGGGGEGGFHTKTPEVMLSALIRGGITTLLGLLGTDGISRSVENLISKAKGLKEEGLSVVACTGSYGYPSTTLTGDVKKDILFIDEVIGVKLALADHRSSHVTTQELIRLASDVRVAGMVSGKAGIVVLHMGDDPQALHHVQEALAQTTIPIKTFRPTHVTRNPHLFAEALNFLEMGGWIDCTCNTKKEQGCGAYILQAKQRKLDLSHITLSSDGQGSWSNYDNQGNLVEIGVSSVGALHQEFCRLVQEYHFSIEEALSFVTLNPAVALELKEKGRIQQEMDADIVLLNQNLAIHSVFAKGKKMMENYQLLVKGTYES